MQDSDLDELDDAALDRLDHGVIGVDHDGIVVRYNRAEAERTGFSRWRVIGRELRELAGAMAAGELADRVRAFSATHEPRARFTCSLRRRRATARAATVELIRSPGGDRVYVCIVPEPTR